jgi:hypothetical protein
MEPASFVEAKIGVRPRPQTELGGDVGDRVPLLVSAITQDGATGGSATRKAARRPPA